MDQQSQFLTVSCNRTIFAFLDWHPQTKYSPHIAALVGQVCLRRFSMGRDAGGREDRQKARLMWLVEACGVEGFRKAVATRMGLEDLPPAVHAQYPDEWKRRDVIGIHAQKQVSWVVCCILSLPCPGPTNFLELVQHYNDAIVPTPLNVWPLHAGGLLLGLCLRSLRPHHG